MQDNKKAFYFLLIPVLLWLVMLIILPHVDLFFSSFKPNSGEDTYTLENYLIFFQDKIYWSTFLYTTAYAIGVTLLAFIVSFPVAFYLVKVISPKHAAFLMLMLLIPLWIGELVTIYGWVILLGDKGAINESLIFLGIIDTPITMLYTNFSMIIGLLYMSMLFMIIPIMTTLESLDDAQIEAASDLGASKFTIFKSIVIPHSMPGIINGSIIVFMLVIGDYLAPNILGGKSSLWFTEQIYNQFLSTFNWNQGAAFGFLLLIISSATIWAALRLSGQKLEKVEN
ncbi:MAG: ABC transporter permease [Sulfurovum sp.]|nr:ABC transporter permease [Sulfurovum sp.]